MNYSPATIEAVRRRFRDHSPKQFLENPEYYLGPNYVAVINFWTFHDSLTHDQFETVGRRWARIKGREVILECKTFLDEIESLILDENGRFKLHWSFNSEKNTTEELIVMHKLLEDGDYGMPFVKLYDNL
jgi:hypothetical protein